MTSDSRESQGRLVLGYAEPRKGAPGGVVALGVASIVLAVLSALSAVIGLNRALDDIRRPGRVAGGGTVVVYSIPRGASGLVAADSAASFFAAGLLGVSGVLILRGWRGAGRLLAIWVAVKIPLLLVWTVAAFWADWDLLSQVAMLPVGQRSGFAWPGTGGNPEMRIVVWTGIAMVYPVVVWLLLSVGKVKGYFGEGEG